MKRKIIHLEIKSRGKHYYYGSVVAMFWNHSDDVLGISKYLFDRHNFDNDNAYENDLIIVRKGYLISSTAQKRNKPAIVSATKEPRMKRNKKIVVENIT